MHTARLPSALYCVRRLCFCYLCCTQCNNNNKYNIVHQNLFIADKIKESATTTITLKSFSM